MNIEDLPMGTSWKGLPIILHEIAAATPGVRLEHFDVVPGEDPEEAWVGPVKKILPVERWIQIVRTDIRNAPSQEARSIIAGPYYMWYYDDFGRATIMAQHQDRIVPMFVEVWAGEPD